MIEKIKRYFRMRRLKKQITHELLETMVTICLYLEREGARGFNSYHPHMRSHAKRLKELSMEFRREEEIPLSMEGIRNDLW